MEGKDEDDDGHTHCNSTCEDNPKTRPNDHHIPRYSSWAPVRVRSFIFVSSYSSSESHLLIFISYFILFVTLSSEYPPRSYPYASFPNSPSVSSVAIVIETYHHPGRSCFCILFLVLQILIIYIYVSSDLILSVNRYGRFIWMVKYASRLLSGTPKGGETATKQKTGKEDVQDIIMNRVSEGWGG